MICRGLVTGLPVRSTSHERPLVAASAARGGGRGGGRDARGFAASGGRGVFGGVGAALGLSWAEGPPDLQVSHISTSCGAGVFF